VSEYLSLIMTLILGFGIMFQLPVVLTLLAHAGIDREVVVVGVGDHLEVWDKGRWAREQEALDGQIEEVTESLGNPS
jgi:DNA-binding transcriptional regulator/RsmH inhibitor MraZ